ncbi:MAG: hypothetical protein HKO65_11385 [Gemmatimonadetes bacterium]|nr:hypothetical protein [Gemmatimonadota bacterium]
MKKTTLTWTFAALLLLSAACEPAEGPPGDISESPATDLYRAPAPATVIDGVAWESGNWEPHLPAGEEGVSWGNHRAVVEVGDADTASLRGAEAVAVTIPWRRRDQAPGSKGIIVVDAATGQVVRNALALRIENASGDVIFQPNPGSSSYHVYYLPWQSSGGYYPTVTYPTPNELLDAARGTVSPASGGSASPSRAQQAGVGSISWRGLAPDPEPGWEAGVESLDIGGLPRGITTHIQSVNEFHSFFPMEVIATPEEEARFWEALPAAGEGGTGNPGLEESEAREGVAGHEDRPGKWAVVPEHRDYPIRMRHFLPHHWVQRAVASPMTPINDVSAETSGPFSTFASQVLRDEAFTFQLGVVSGSEALEGLTVSFDGFPPSWTESLTCFNCGGIGEKGQVFPKEIDVPAETVQPIWIGVGVPGNQGQATVTGIVTVASSNRGSRSIQVSLDVRDETAPNSGYNEPELQTRLAWLNSRVGSEPDFIIEPFVPVTVNEPMAFSVPTLSILGRSVELGPTGLPAQIYSYFTPDLTGFAEEPEPILAHPLELRVVTPGAHREEFSPSPFAVRQVSRGRAEWTTTSSSDYLEMTVEGALEYDGMLDLRITLAATSDAAIDDVVLPVSLVPDAAEYMLGLGRRGGKRPHSLYWKWAVENHQEGVWFGGVHKGLQYVLRDENYVRPLNTNFYTNQPLNMPPSWHNEGKGGIQVFEEREPGDPDGPDQPLISVTAENYSGPREVLEGDTLHLNIRFLITPFKPIDTATHFNTRFVHQYVPVDSVQAWGGTVVNIHHANEINPYINYPFFNLDLQKAYIEEAHEKGIKVKLYNTIRELTYKAHELFAFRSLGDEILNDGEGGGHSWMQEHMESDYHSAWHAWRVDDAAMLNKGTSRWTNYYIEGLNWLAQNQHIDGLYLDDIAFSRETVKRLVTVLNEHREEVVIDLHSANQFNVRDGFTNSAMLYMEHFPFISRLWFGEYFEYDLDEDYWMTEVSGLPFGLMGEMLQDGGHPYRGMLYGMTGRKYGGNDPRPVWAMMNDFGIADSRMNGYWLDDPPVTTDHPRILATTYVRPDAVLVALASWSDQDEVVSLELDLEALGFLADVGAPETGVGPDSTVAEESGASTGEAVLRAYAPSVEGIQAGGEIDLSAVTVPAGQGLFVVIERQNGR